MSYPYQKKPYKKRTKKKKIKSVPFSRKEFYNMNKKVTKIGRAVENIVVNFEKKKYDVGPISDNTVTYNGIIDTLNDVPQGSTDVTRVGDALTSLYADFRVTWFAHATAVTTARFMVIVDKHNTVTALGDIWNQAGTAYSTIGMVDHDLADTVSVLYDSNLISLVPSTDSGVQSFSGRIHIPKKYGKCQFEAGTQVVNTNKLLVLFMTDAVPATNFPEVDYFFRLTYTDN